MFVPPFKKQRIQDSYRYSKQEKDKRQIPSTVESNSNTFVPPAIRTPRTTDVVASVDSENPNVSNIQGVPVNTEVNSSEAEASAVVDSFSKNPGRVTSLPEVDLNKTYST